MHSTGGVLARYMPAVQKKIGAQFMVEVENRRGEAAEIGNVGYSVLFGGISTSAT